MGSRFIRGQCASSSGSVGTPSPLFCFSGCVSRVRAEENRRSGLGGWGENGGGAPQTPFYCHG